MENKKTTEQNYTNLLKIFATFMSISSAILCFIIFIYWKGYADNLGINTNSMDISYKENIYTILLASPNLIILFVSSLFISKLFSHKQINKEIIKKICLIVFITFILNMYILHCYNSFQFNIRFIISLLIIYILLLLIGVLIIISMPSTKNQKYSVIISLILLIVLGVSSVYSVGYESIKNKIAYQITNNNKYVVVYTNKDKYILNSVKIKDDKLIFTNKTQMIVDCNNVELTKRKFKNVEVRNP